MTRLVAVLGYSDGRSTALHPVCRARVARAADEVQPDDVVLFSGFARDGCDASEADLMAASWSASSLACLVDREARTTLGNALAVARATRRLDVDEVVLVTSRWHARRAAVLARAALLGSGATVRVAAADEPSSAPRRLREAASWLVVPVLAAIAARTR
jgi:uncharacterized SAM-binding protein YcdF (DUF218 family)